MKPWRARECELILAGARADAALFPQPPRQRLAEAKPSRDNGFRSSSRDWIVVRALTLATAGTPGAPCPRFQHPHSPPFLEMSSMPEIALTQAAAHVRHGSNIRGQPLTRRGWGA